MKTAPKQDLYLKIDGYERDIFEIVDNIKKYILSEECPFLVIDISKLNIIDATKIGAMCSTYHFSKYPDGNITWKVNDIETLHSIRQLKLKTVSIELNPRTNKTIEYIEKKYRSNIF